MGSILTSGRPQFGHRRVHIPAPPSEAPGYGQAEQAVGQGRHNRPVSPKCAHMLRWSGASSRARVERCAPRCPMWLGKLLSGHGPWGLPQKPWTPSGAWGGLLVGSAWRPSVVE
jgi:hypothetical protein